jgi:endonuclease/exonuclease/phosphatase family metal-dependent hydrolase
MYGYAEVIKEIAPAIVGLQECQNRDGLASAAGYSALTGIGYCNYILYNSSKVTPMSQGSMSIPRDNYASRCISWGQFRFGDSAIWFFNTHLPHNHNEAWSKTTHAQIAHMLLDKRKELGAENAPTVVLGDFNSHASDHNNVAGGGFRSNLQENGFTWAYMAQGSPGYGSIDHILYSTPHWTHQNCRDTGTGGSDHTSITCDLVLKT